MSERAAFGFVTSFVWGMLVLWASYNGIREGRCQSACWLSGWSYVAIGTSVCECADDGVPMTTAIPREPKP